MNKPKNTVHFVDNYLLNPTNPITINLIGAGGTGSQVLTALARMNHSLLALDHPGIFVRLFDDDIVTKSNLGRQLFAPSELGMHKSAALIARVNKFFGSNWKSVAAKYELVEGLKEELFANITISCVDTVKARYTIATVLSKLERQNNGPYKLIYWMDFGNSQYTGQVVLSTVYPVKQPPSQVCQTVSALAFVTKQYGRLLKSVKEDDQPSCSMSEALAKQDLFINTSLSALGASLLWNLFREGMTSYRGFFLNLKQFSSNPIPITNSK
ncbi:MAG: PRTRC system ThiF family protein [Bacteroidota bacterium]